MLWITYIYIYIYCDEGIWHPNTFCRQRTMITDKNQRTIVESRIMEGDTISPSPLFIITRWDRHVRASLSISHVCVSGEANPTTIFGTDEELAKKKKINTWRIFKLSSLPSIHHRVETHKSCHVVVKRGRRTNSCRCSLKNQEHNLGIWKKPVVERPSQIPPLTDILWGA